MPQKRRVLSCHNCRRLKTRCTVLPGVSSCSRCHNLKLECVLPTSLPAPSAANDVVDDDQTILEKLSAVTTSLNDIKQLLRQSRLSAFLREPGSRETRSDDVNHHADPDERNSAADQTDVEARDFRIEPVTTVRQFAASIDGPFVDETTSLDSALEPLKDYLEVLEDELLERFWKISDRFRFTDLVSLTASKTGFPLFYYTCLLLAIQGHPVHRASNLHSYLHKVVKEHLAKTILITQGNMTFVQTLLIFTIWSLEPTRLQYTDSWLLSGMAIQHWVLAAGRSFFGWDSNQHPNAENIKHMMRLCIIARTENLKFAVGTGQAAMIDHQQASIDLEYARKRLSHPNDISLMSELQLFLILYRTIILKSLDARSAWAQVQSWALQKLSDHDKALTFAHSSVSLILARWETARLSEAQDLSTEDAPRTGRALELDKMVVLHAKSLLSLMQQLSRETHLVKTAYHRLLGSYSAIVLVEYAACIPDLAEPYSLLQQAVKEQVHAGFKEPILEWTMDMMGKKVMERSTVELASQLGVQAMEHEDIWIPYDLVNSSGFEGQYNVFNPPSDVN